MSTAHATPTPAPLTAWVIKVGGHVVDRPEALARLLDALAATAAPWVLVHGGGKLATELAERLGLPQTLIEGRRVTDADTLRIAAMVYAGWINKHIVAQLQARGVNAHGLTGADADLLRARRRPPVTVNGQLVDYGHVGDVVAARAEALTALWAAGQRPVVAPLTHDGAGALLNTNADTVAQALAVALANNANENGNEGPVRLVYAFERAGVLREASDAQSVIGQIRAGELEGLRAAGVVSGGMLPKLANAFAAIGQGVTSVHIAHADALPELLAGRPAGTLLTA